MHKVVTRIGHLIETVDKDVNKQLDQGSQYLNTLEKDAQDLAKVGTGAHHKYVGALQLGISCRMRCMVRMHGFVPRS